MRRRGYFSVFKMPSKGWVNFSLFFKWILALSVHSDHCRAIGCRMGGGGVREVIVVLGKVDITWVNPSWRGRLPAHKSTGWWPPKPTSQQWSPFYGEGGRGGDSRSAHTWFVTSTRLSVIRAQWMTSIRSGLQKSSGGEWSMESMKRGIGCISGGYEMCSCASTEWVEKKTFKTLGLPCCWATSMTTNPELLTQFCDVLLL